MHCVFPRQNFVKGSPRTFSLSQSVALLWCFSSPVSVDCGFEERTAERTAGMQKRLFSGQAQRARERSSRSPPQHQQRTRIIHGGCPLRQRERGKKQSRIYRAMPGSDDERGGHPAARLRVGGGGVVGGGGGSSRGGHRHRRHRRAGGDDGRARGGGGGGGGGVVAGRDGLLRSHRLHQRRRESAAAETVVNAR